MSVEATPAVLLTKDLGIAAGKKAHAEEVSNARTQGAMISGLVRHQRQQQSLRENAAKGLQQKSTLQQMIHQQDMDRMLRIVQADIQTRRTSDMLAQRHHEFQQGLIARQQAFDERLAPRRKAVQEGQQRMIAQQIEAQRSGSAGGGGTPASQANPTGFQISEIEAAALQGARNRRLETSGNDEQAVGLYFNEIEPYRLAVAEGVITEMVYSNVIPQGQSAQWLGDVRLRTDLEGLWEELRRQFGAGLPMSFSQLQERAAQLFDARANLVT